MRRTKGFTLVELLVVVAIIAVLASLLLPSLGRARELARQSTCMANLKSTSSAIETYKADNKSRPPRIVRYGNPLSNFTATTMDDALWTDANATPPTTQLGSGGSVAAMQNVWLLIAKDLIPQDAFTCPSDPDFTVRKETGVGTKYGWTSWEQMGYGMHYPSDTASADGTGEANPAAWTDHISGSVAILADKSPDSGATDEGNRKVYAGDDIDGTGQIKPPNHEKDGEAYLLANGSAAFYKELDSAKGNRPINSNCGKNGDNIYDGGNGADFPKTHDEALSGGGTVTIGGEIDTFIVPNVGP
jgi:prepilin-type N-terminal cleavage/methylation domain-containing protein